MNEFAFNPGQEAVITTAFIGEPIVGFGTDRGRRREINEDSVIAVDPLFAVADGMGGHEAGEVASQACLQSLGHNPLFAAGSRNATVPAVRLALREADESIRELTNARGGTTVSGVVLVQHEQMPHLLVFNIGDSRVYQLKDKTLTQLTVDHSEVQELLNGGYITPEQASVYPRRHVITRALGAGAFSKADVSLIPITEPSRILVCTDGLTGELTDQQIRLTLIALDKPQEAVDSLIAQAVNAGGNDNITVIIIDLVPQGAGAELPVLDTTDAVSESAATSMLEEKHG